MKDHEASGTNLHGGPALASDDDLDHADGDADDGCERERPADDVAPVGILVLLVVLERLVLDDREEENRLQRETSTL